MIRMTRRAGAAPMPGRCREASMPGWLQVYNNKAACSCPSSLSKFGGGTWTSGFARGKHVIKFVQVPCPSSCPSSGSSGGEFSYPNIFFFWLSGSRYIITRQPAEPLVQVRPRNLDKELGQLRAAVLQALSVLRPDSRQAPIPTSWPRAETRTWTRTWTRNLDKFYHVFSSCRATCPSSPAELGQGTWTTAGCRVTSSLSITPRFQAGPDSNFVAQSGNPNLDKNLDKELGQVLSRVFLLQSHLSKFARGTWTRNLDNCGLPCYKLSQYYAPIPGRPLSLEGFFQMAYILPERLLALVRPAFDLVLRRIRSLKRCVQACGCKIETPRYALQFGSRLHFKRCQALPKETRFPFFSGTPFFGTPCFLFF